MLNWISAPRVIVSLYVLGGNAYDKLLVTNDTKSIIPIRVWVIYIRDERGHPV
jgi:hypothetical protein